MNDDNFDSFVNSLVTEKNLQGLTPEGREQVVAELKNLVAEEVNRAILMELSDEKLDELDKLMDKGPLSESEMQQFLRNSGVDVPKVTTKTLMYFRSFYLGGK
jgi:hypothetical protein